MDSLLYFLRSPNTSLSVCFTSVWTLVNPSPSGLRWSFAASTAHLDVCSRVDLMNAIAWCSARLPVQIETLDKHRVVAKATHPDVTLPPTLQLNPPADVEPAGQQHQQH